MQPISQNKELKNQIFCRIIYDCFFGESRISLSKGRVLTDDSRRAILSACIKKQLQVSAWFCIKLIKCHL
jgi:hypothetical protein